MGRKIETVCIVCPVGCPIAAEESDGVFRVSGNACGRGKEYGIGELISPVRTVTASVSTTGGGVTSVKTSSPIPKAMIFDVLNELKRFSAPEVFKIGDILVKNILGTGSDIVITSNMR
jgi:CxxC motif-containing protein